MLARVRLAEIRNSVSAADWGLLMAVAGGMAYHVLNRAGARSSFEMLTSNSPLRWLFSPDSMIADHRDVH